MWLVIHMAKSRAAAEALKDALLGEGFLVKMNPVYRALADEENYFELMVPEGEAKEARQVLLNRGLM